MIREYLESEIDQALAEKISKLACASFPSDKTVADRVQELMQQEKEGLQFSTSRRFVIFGDSGDAVAHAKTFVREINTDSGALSVLALATVCTEPELRGQGLGVQVTRKAFEQVGESDWPRVSLFQTPVPAFYEKLGCRIVTNKFVDRTNKAAPDAFPWRDKTIMIYPADYAWPDGTIDINGPDY